MGAYGSIVSEILRCTRAGAHRTYMETLERGESGVTVEALAAILGGARREFFRPFRPKTPKRRD